MSPQVTIDPDLPARLPADIPDSAAEVALLQSYLDLQGTDAVAGAMLGSHMHDLPSVVRPLLDGMLKRAAIVLRRKKAVVEQGFREQSPEILGCIADVHSHVAREQVRYVNSAYATLKSKQSLPDRIQAVLNAAPAASGLRFVLAFLRSGHTTVTITGDSTREVTSVFCSRKQSGLAAVKTADSFSVNLDPLEAGIETFYKRLGLALQAIAEIRSGTNPTLLGAFETADRAKIEQRLGYIELQAAKGSTNTKYLAEVNGLKIDRFPDLRARLDAALALVGMPPDERHAERWVSFVEAAAAKGYLYDRGVQEVEQLDLSSRPSLAARFEAAVLAGRRGAVLKWVAYVEDSASKGYLYARGVEALGLMDLDPFPDLRERLNVAIDLAARNEADQESDGKTLVLASAPPPPGELWEVPGSDTIVFVQRLGLAYPINERTAQAQGPALLDHVGELGQLAHWRHTTPAELEAFFMSADVRPEAERDSRG